MGRAVAVLREAALDRRRLEGERLGQAAAIEETRRQTEAERERASERQRRQAGELREIVEIIGKGLERLAGGDLSEPIHEIVPEAYATLRDNYNDAVERLARTVVAIQATVGDVDAAVSEISIGAGHLAQRTEQQASALTQTSASAEQIVALVQKAAAASGELDGHAGEAVRAAESGGAIAAQAVDAMARIQGASGRISDITRLIDDIAFRPTCSRSTPRSRPRAPGKPARASRWWHRRCACWRSARARPRRTSPG